MEAFLDALLAFLLANVGPSLPAAAQFILGDPGMSAPTSLPFIYVVPLFDSVAALSGIDMDTYVIPIICVDDLHNYGPPVDNANATGTLEQPGYRKLMEYGQAIRSALRAGGAGITVGGIAAATSVPAIKYVWPTIDKKPYRGVQIALTVRQRRARA